LKNVVLDSYAVLAFLFREPGHEAVLALLERTLEEPLRLMISAPNWAEVRYIVERRVGTKQWTEVRYKLLGIPWEIIPADGDLAEAAGEIKAAHKMSLADCFAAALAKQYDAHIYTGDPEFHAVEKAVEIIWI
jgi:predicted nucleic acid-binding protein